MHDIRLALGLIGFLALGIFLALRRLLRGAPPRLLDSTAILLILLMAVYVRYVWGQLWIVEWIPLPSVLVLSNWFPLLLAGMAGVVWVRMGGETTPEQRRSNSWLAVRRTVMMVSMTGVAAWSVLSFVPVSPPVCGNEWAPPVAATGWPVCLQTNGSTCSAAAAATILTTLQIPASEQEMARLCLTRNGTTWLGLYHGLTTKLRGTRHRAQFFEAGIEALPGLAQQHPLLLCCKLERADAQEAPEYVTHGGWRPGTAHSVVYFGRRGAHHIIGDPSRGYEAWRDEDLQILWTGEGLRITDLPRQQP